MSGSEESAVVTFDQQRKMSIPDFEIFACRIIDWVRIRRNIAQLTKPIPWLQIAYSLFIGVFISTGLGYLLIQKTESLPIYVIPIYQCVIFFSFVISVVFVVLDIQGNKQKTSDVNKIIQDMKSIENIVDELRDLPELKELNGLN